MGILDSLYSMGAETASSAAIDHPTPGTVTAAHAMSGIKAADRLAAQVHREIETRASPNFKIYWRKFYNEWLTYKTLNADREVRADPKRVLEQELPRFTRRIYEWRDLLARETGRPAAVAGESSQTGTKEISWRPIAALGAAVAGGMLFKSWLSAREKERERARMEELEAERQRILALAAPPPPQAPQAPQVIYEAAPPRYVPYRYGYPER